MLIKHNNKIKILYIFVFFDLKKFFLSMVDEILKCN